MPWVTGVELGPESCALARVRTAGDRVQLSAVRGQTDEDWDLSRTLVQNLANARRRGRFPRTARVVVWGLNESASETDAAAFGLVSPLREAGFTIDAVMTPAQALTVLSSRRPSDAQGPMVWLALNRHRAAIAIIDSGRLLYSREFDWRYRSATTVREELLQRYTLVAHLAPEIRHGLDVAGAEHGAAPGGIVTCGDLPELRSLTMPLIEELELEVETLDTLEGFDLDRSADREILTEKASALYLAVAAGVKDPQAQAIEPARWLAAAGVVAVVAMLLMGGWLTLRSVSHRTPEPARVAAPPVPARQPQAPAVRPSPAPVEPPAQPAEASTPAATTGRRETQGQKPAAATAAAPRREEGVQPLRDPLPVVNSILVAPDRRLAVVGGEIVREGDAIGRRVLIRIERDGLLLREPSGHEVRVYIRRRVSSSG